MNPADFIKSLQSKPEHVRRRIFWICTAVSFIIVFCLWLLSFKQAVLGLNIKALPKIGSVSTVQTEPHYLNISRLEVKDDKLLVYFSVQNDSSDILNFAKESAIKLSLNGKDFQSGKITNRQNQTFVSKILSHSQNFGILSFDTNADSGRGQVSFDGLFFEQNPDRIFKEVLPIDLEKLSEPETLRN